MADLEDVLADFRAGFELVKEAERNMPPPIHKIMASHSVPWPKVYKQWRSDGRLIVWVNRGAVHDLPLKDHPEKQAYLIDMFTQIWGVLSIPVEFV